MQAFMFAEDLGAGFLGLIERGGQDVGGDAFDLGVELQGRDELGRAGDLEVHVAERVLGTEDVGERRVLALGVHEAHGDAGDGGLDRHTRVHQRQRTGAHRRHRGRTVRRQHLGHEAQRVAELLLARQHRQQRTGGERTVADLATLRRTDTAGLTVGPRSHVVVEQEVLVGLRAEGVHQLVHPRHGHGDDVHHLGLATLEQAGAVRRRQHGDLAAERTQVARTTTVDAQALVDDPLADRLLGEAANGFFHFTLAAGELGTLAAQLLDGLGCGGVGGGVALGLGADRDGLGHTVAGDRGDGVEHVLACSRAAACMSSGRWGRGWR